MEPPKEDLFRKNRSREAINGTKASRGESGGGSQISSLYEAAPLGGSDERSDKKQREKK